MPDTIKRNNVTVVGHSNPDKTIILGNGFGTDQSAWNDVTAAFSDEYRIIQYDNVGGGGSDPKAYSSNRYNTLHSYADDLLAICNALNIKDAIFVGHSVSGMIGLLAGIQAPQYFRKMIFVGASARYLNDTDYIGGFEQADLDQLYSAMTNNYYAWVSGFAAATMENADKPQLAESFARSLSAIRPDIAQDVSRVIFQSDHRKALPQFGIDTLIVQTKHDIAVPFDASAYLHSHIKNSKLKIVAAEGHFPHISAPNEVISAIRSYI